jgi:hypothetical protein
MIFRRSFCTETAECAALSGLRVLFSLEKGEAMAHSRISVVPLAAFFLVWNPAGSLAANCSASYTINLTVELSPELTNNKNNLLIELRQGSVGHSKVINKKEFVGHSGIVVFSRLCAGPYFIDIGNGEQVAVGPTHLLRDNQYLDTTVQVSFSQGNINTMSRSGL